MAPQCCCELGHPGDASYKPRGQTRTIGNLQAYEVHPKSGESRGILLVLPDGFGLVQHNYILCDMFADRGWRVILPDYFEGDALPITLLNRPPGTPLEVIVDMKAWLSAHSPERIKGLLERFHEELRQSSDADISLTRYCFGGKYAFHMSSWDGVKRAAGFHPSFVQEGDLAVAEGKDAGQSAKIFAGLAENDTVVPKTLSEDLNAWSKKHSRVLEQRTFPGMSHGFGARPNAKNPAEKAQFEAAFEWACTILQ